MLILQSAKQFLSKNFIRPSSTPTSSWKQGWLIAHVTNSQHLSLGVVANPDVAS